MKVSTCKFFISAFLAFFCQAAVATEQFNLSPCTEEEGTSGSKLYCTDDDSMGDISYLHDNITRRITVKLPLLALTQLWLNQGEIVILTPSGEVINNGQELIRSQDRDRWTITFTFQHVNSDYGMLHLVLHITDVEYRDEQLFHVEIRTADNIFATREKIWFPVQVKSNKGDSDHEGKVTTTDDPAAKDPSAILRKNTETPKNKTEVLQQKLITTENDLSRCEREIKFFRYLEAKGENEEHKVPDIIILLILALLLICTGLLLWMVMGSTLVHKTTNLDGIETTGNRVIPIPRNNALTFENFNGEKLRFTIQNEPHV